MNSTFKYEYLQRIVYSFYIHIKCDTRWISFNNDRRIGWYNNLSQSSYAVVFRKMFACQISKLIRHYFYYGRVSRSERSPLTADELYIRMSQPEWVRKRDIHYFSLFFDMSRRDPPFQKSRPNSKEMTIPHHQQISYRNVRLLIEKYPASSRSSFRITLYLLK